MAEVQLTRAGLRHPLVVSEESADHWRSLGYRDVEADTKPAPAKEEAPAKEPAPTKKAAAKKAPPSAVTRDSVKKGDDD